MPIGLYEEKKQKEERQQAELNERARLRSSLLNGESTEQWLQPMQDGKRNWNNNWKKP